MRNRAHSIRLWLSHFVLIGACLLVLLPVLRAVSISLQDTGAVGASLNKPFPPRGEAGALDYARFVGQAFFPFAEESVEEAREAEEELALPSDDDFEEFDRPVGAGDGSHRWYTNYIELFVQHEFVRWVWNSLLVSVVSAFLGLALSSSAAYAYSRFRFPGRKLGLGLIMTSQMIPGPMLIIPVYLVIKTAGLGNSYTGYILALTVSTLPFALMILKGYFDTIPLSLEEAARVDGCSRTAVFFRIILPLSVPVLVIAFLFNFIAAWTEFILAATLIDDNDLRTWPLGIMAFANNYDSRWGIMCAACVLIAVPGIGMFLYSARYMIRGITLGAVKG